MSRKWFKKPSGNWQIRHRPGTDPTFNPFLVTDRPSLDPPHGPTHERLTIRKLEGLPSLDAKYADALANGKALQNRLP